MGHSLDLLKTVWREPDLEKLGLRPVYLIM